MVGSNRIVPASRIISPLGNPELKPEDEKALRKTIIEEALKSLQEEIQEQRVFNSAGY